MTDSMSDVGLAVFEGMCMHCPHRIPCQGFQDEKDNHTQTIACISGALAALRNAGMLQELWPDPEDINEYTPIQWRVFTRRTDEPKLTYIEHMLDTHGIPHRRNGESWHAPITEVPLDRFDEAWELLDPIDDIEDDDPMFSGGEPYVPFVGDATIDPFIVTEIMDRCEA